MKQSEFTSRATFVPKGGGKAIFTAMVVLMAVASTFGQDATTNSPLSQLADMDITNLFDIKVSIVSPNAPETIPQTPAAVSVVSAKDIERSGAQNYPQALRLVPGMNVAQLDSSQWAVSSRGFSDVFANKLLVMQDGCSIYTPLFSGVFWDVQGTLLQDIDQIEVVRGPGATIWGANAMNGVINIITKSAADTQGLLASGGGGAQQRGFAGARYGGAINSNAFYRVYATYQNHDSTVLSDGSDANNSWQLARAGFRTDWNPTDRNLFTFQGDGYAGWINQVFDEFNPTILPTFTTTNGEVMKVSGANGLGRWTHTISDTSNFKLQAYYDYTARYANNLFDEQRHTFDLDFKHQFALGTRNNVVWGMGYRITSDSEGNNPTIAFYRESQAVNLYSAFVQNELTIVPDHLSLTVGSKFEQNDYTGFDFQPSARLLWTPTEHHTFWASVSRAVRTPSRAEESVILTQAIPVPPPSPFPYAPATILGTNTFKNENMIAYEIGYRAQPIKNLSFDVDAYWNHYNDLRSEAPVSQTVVYLANNIHGNAYGGEISLTWRILDWWRLQPSYSYLKTSLHVNTVNGYTDNYSVGLDEGSSPQHQFMIRSSMDLPHDITFDTALRFVDKLEFPQPSPVASTITVPDYFELDARLAWRINKNWEVAVIGQNMLHDRHSEFLPTYVHTQATEIPRTVFAQVTYQF
ncbi:MAG TPA: TonB-dependent receptor [Verrucomicrobiae bacterium]|jgi:iron complex outermembrane receptor protein|nr:TonB-dependent receptor [Verrucomicrobiae bacterium]